jgi:hypothetical protein
MNHGRRAKTETVAEALAAATKRTFVASSD